MASDEKYEGVVAAQTGHVNVHEAGAMLAKGRLLGIQFDMLFSDDLYFEISAHAIEMAEKMKMGLREKGYTFYLDSPTNQQFVILSMKQIDELQNRVSFDLWDKLDEDRQVVRFATSWVTKEQDVEELLKLLEMCR